MLVATIIRATLTQRLMVMLVAMGLAAAGIWAFRELPIDAYPDISSPQVQVIVKAPGLAPLEVESRITRIIEPEKIDAEKEKNLATSLQQAAGQEQFAAYLAGLKQKSDVKIRKEQLTDRKEKDK